MKTKFAVIALAVGILTGSAPALASEASFDPSIQWYDMNGDGTLRLWGVPEANGNALAANPDYGWPVPVAIASWYATIL